jgi:hypothetical protein
MQNIDSKQQLGGPVEVSPSWQQRVRASFASVTKLPKNLIFTLVFGMVGCIGLFLYGRAQEPLQRGNATEVQAREKATTVKPSQSSEASTPNQLQDTQKAPVPTKPVTSPPSSTQSSTVTPSAPAAPLPTTNTTNCLPSSPSQYDLYYQNMTNAQYLQTNSYADTSKFYDALEFAGLLDTVNRKQHVVLAMSDGAWNNLTQAQRDWMNASPTNMRSVLGWQITTSCITYKGANPTKDMAAGTTQVVNTLNGSITFTAGGMGKFENTPVYIWDWYTSNGAVTFSGFIRPPQI